MRLLSSVLMVVVAGSFPACTCTKTVYVYVCDSGVGPDGEPDVLIDGPQDAMPDTATDAAPDALACVRSGDTADSLLQVGHGGYPAPQMTADGFGAVATYPVTGGGGALVQLDATGSRRAADLTLPTPPVAVVFDGTGYWIVEDVTTTVQLRSLSTAGVLGTPIAIGTGRGVPGALAIHPSGDLAMLWVSGVDGSLRATVVPATGVAVETVLDDRPFVITVQLVGGVTALTGSGAKFMAAFERFNGTNAGFDVLARPLGPAGTAQAIATSGATDPTRVTVVPGATGGTGLVTWREGNDVHAAIGDAVAAPVLPDIVVLTASGLTRVGGRTNGTGFDVLVDHAISSSDRAIEQLTFDPTGAQVGTTRRVATICSNSYSEDNLPFVRNTSVRYSTWFDMSLTSSVVATF